MQITKMIWLGSVFNWATGRHGHLHRRSPGISRRDESRCACRRVFYATDIHKGSLGKGMKDNSLGRAVEIKENYCTSGEDRDRMFRSKEETWIKAQLMKWARVTSGSKSTASTHSYETKALATIRRSRIKIRGCVELSRRLGWRSELIAQCEGRRLSDRRHQLSFISTAY